MHSLAAAGRPRLSETKPKWFVFETSCHSFVGRIRHFVKISVNKVNIVLPHRIHSTCKLFVSIYIFNILTIRLSAQRNSLPKRNKLSEIPINNQTTKYKVNHVNFLTLNIDCWVHYR